MPPCRTSVADRRRASHSLPERGHLDAESATETHADPKGAGDKRSDGETPRGRAPVALNASEANGRIRRRLREKKKILWRDDVARPNGIDSQLGGDGINKANFR